MWHLIAIILVIFGSIRMKKNELRRKRIAVGLIRPRIVKELPRTPLQQWGHNVLYIYFIIFMVFVFTIVAMVGAAKYHTPDYSVPSSYIQQ